MVTLHSTAVRLAGARKLPALRVSVVLKELRQIAAADGRKHTLLKEQVLALLDAEDLRRTQLDAAAMAMDGALGLKTAGALDREDGETAYAAAAATGELLGDAIPAGKVIFFPPRLSLLL